LELSFQSGASTEIASMRCARLRRLARYGGVLNCSSVPPNELFGDAQYEYGVGLQVTSPEAFGLAQQTVEPFESSALHPERRTPQRTGVMIQRGAHAYHHSVDRAAMLRHPTFLLGTSEPNEHDRCTGRVDQLDRRAVFSLALRAVRRRGGTDNLQLGKMRLEIGLQPRQRAPAPCARTAATSGPAR